MQTFKENSQTLGSLAKVWCSSEKINSCCWSFTETELHRTLTLAFEYGRETLTLFFFFFCWQGYYFHTDNPYKDTPNAFEEGQKKSREGDLQNAVLLLEAAVLQDPHDSEVKLYT